MSTGSNTPVTNPRMRTARSVVGLIGFVGLVGNILFAVAEDEYELDTWVWALAFVTAIVFWHQAGRFIETPDRRHASSLKPASYAFTALWVLGVAATYLVWEALYPETYAGIGVGVLGTFLTIQFSNDAEAELSQQG